MAVTRPRRGEAPAVLLDTARVLWPDAEGLEITRDPRVPVGAVDHVVLPRVSSPRWLLPVRAGSTAGALAGQGMSRRRRAAVRLVALGQRSGVLPRLPVRRLRIIDAGESFLDAVADLVGDGVGVAVRLGSWPYARSVVVRAFGPDGSTVAFGKAGIDAHGRAAVAAEARALSRVAGLGLVHVVHPEVVHQDSWRDLEVLLVSPLLPPTRPGTGTMPTVAMHELAHAGGARAGDLRDSGWWVTVAQRLDTVVDPDLRRGLAAVLTRLEQASSGASVPLGPWHGDWTPWNMAEDGARVLLWDWEHFAEDVPVGFDHVHYLAQQHRESAGTGADAEASWRRRADEALADHVGLDPAQRAIVRAAYLLEVNLRFVLDRQTTPDAGQRRDGWGLDLMRAEAERLG